MASVLTFFTGVRNLSLVVKDPQPTQDTDLVFLDYKDLEKDFGYHFEDCEEKYHWVAREEFPEVNELPDALSESPEWNFKMSKLEEHRQKIRGPHGLPIWAMPKVDIRLATTSHGKHIFQVKREIRDMEKAARRMQALIGSPVSSFSKCGFMSSRLWETW